jgi:hypothetical protein
MANKFGSTINRSISNILTDALNGKYPVNVGGSKENNLFGDGVSVTLGENKVSSAKGSTRNIVAMAPEASILIKKKAFTTFKDYNDIQWLDRTEKMLLRATKTLFAFKVSQIRAYESLTKLENAFTKTSEIDLSLFIELLHNSKYLSVADENLKDLRTLELIVGAVNAALNSVADVAYDDIKEDILRLLERNAFSGTNNLTTWIVDPNDKDQYGIGPGTGVIELGTFTSFKVGLNLNSDPNSASFEMLDPYRIMIISEEDIELAIQEALVGTLGLLNDMIHGDGNISQVDPRSIVASGVELLGLGGLDGTLDVNYIRDRLRVFYLGRSIVNPGDGIHFYIRGNKNLFDHGDQKESLDPDYFNIDESILEAERILFTSGKIDFQTYKNIRQYSDNSLSMRHVFAGMVLRSSESWSGGSWSLSITCNDNMEWLKWSRFVIQPALQDPQGFLEDPLTPYEIKTDATGAILTAGGTQLLEENKELLKSGLLFYDSGILNGQVASESNLLQGQFNKGGSLAGAKVMQHPHGLIYRWKSGIITSTAGINVVDPYNESQVSVKTHNQTYGLTAAKDVLNNLDIANILSILIVGQPYNVESFIDQAYFAHNISKKTSNGTLSPHDPLSSVLDVIRRQNSRFGNFRPYRMITMSSQTLLQTANDSILRGETNEKIKQLQQRRIQLQNLLKKLKPGPDSSTNINGTLVSTLERELHSINDGITAQLNLLKESGKVDSSDLITQNFNLFGRSKTLPLSGNYTADHQISRAMSILGAQRRIEDVRLNRDQNLFIVNDQYDEQTDIRPFIFQLKNSDYSLFKGEYIDTFTKITEAVKWVNFEFFCNSQGHLEFRPPQWNRTPLSVLQKLFDISKNTDRKIIPEFLTQIFQTRTSSFRREIHSFNIRIVILALLLGKYPDKSLIPNFSSAVTNGQMPAGTGFGPKSLKFFGVKEDGVNDDGANSASLRNGNFNLGVGKLANTGNQLLGNGFSLDISPGAENGNLLNGDTETLLGVFDQVFQENSGIVQDVLNAASASASASKPPKIATTETLNDLREAFVKMSGSDPVSDIVSNNGQFSESDFIFSSVDGESGNIAKAERYLQLLEQTISNRDKLVSILLRNLAKEKELEEVDEILSGEILNQDTSNSKVTNFLDRVQNTIKTAADIFTGDASQGSLFDHLIEDDSRNLLGPGSGKRYIINDVDIISCTFNEDPPDFVRVDVNGNAPVTGDSLNQAFGEKYYWAGATDFDLWRQYGHKTEYSIALPFASSAELQCKPYAIMALQLEKLRINQASITVAGNEYYEPGDTVYLPDKGLLYYIRGIDHQFNYGSSFVTNLTLEYGHAPGTYLPSPMDIIGQQYLKDPFFGNTMVYRNTRGDDNYRVLQPDSCIAFPGQTITEENISVLLDYRDNAVRFTNMMIDLNTTLIGERVVLIRGFVKGKDDDEANKVRGMIDTIKFLLQNPQMLTQSEPTNTSDDLRDSVSGLLRGFGATTGTTKSTTTMLLPNGLSASPVAADKIVEQLVFLSSDGETFTQIQCLNPKLLSAQKIENSSVADKDFESIFPRGGPKQRTWLDIRSDTNGKDKTVNAFSRGMDVSSVIEIGILDINRAIKTASPTNKLKA